MTRLTDVRLWKAALVALILVTVWGVPSSAWIHGRLTGSHVVVDFGADTASVDGASVSVSSVIATFTRSGVAWQFDLAGTYSQVADGIRRQTDRGTIIEGARTNIVRNNRALEQATWTTAGVTAAKDQTGIDGASNSASSIVGAGTISTTTTATSANRTGSAFVKCVVVCIGTLEMSIDSAASYTAITPSGTSWERKLVPFQAILNPTVVFRITGAGTFGIDFVQLENSSVGASSPILTSGAAATRNAETFGLVNSYFDMSQGTILAEVNMVQIDGSIGEIVNFRLTADNKIVVETLTSNVLTSRSFVANNIEADLQSTGATDRTSTYKACFSYQLNAFASAYSASIGPDPAPSVSGAVPPKTNPTFSGILNNNGGQQGYMYIKRFEYYPTALGQAFCQAYAN